MTADHPHSGPYGARDRSLDVECWEYDVLNIEGGTTAAVLRDLADTLDRTGDTLLSLQVAGEGGELVQAFVEVGDPDDSPGAAS